MSQGQLGSVFWTVNKTGKHTKVNLVVNIYPNTAVEILNGGPVYVIIVYSTKTKLSMKEQDFNGLQLYHYQTNHSNYLEILLILLSFSHYVNIFPLTDPSQRSENKKINK